MYNCQNPGIHEVEWYKRISGDLVHGYSYFCEKHKDRMKNLNIWQPELLMNRDLEKKICQECYIYISRNRHVLVYIYK